MSVLSYLENTVETVKIADWERAPILTSISTLSLKLIRHFNNLNSKFVFGSFDRRTILRRSVDTNSDVDYMVVFNDGAQCQPQTLINRLKIFSETYYSRNEIYQSYPTIVLELSHIKFELVPAYVSYGTYYIPAPSSSYMTWISTNPDGLKANLESKQNSNNYKIRDLILLLKYWNVKNDKVYSSYELENYVINRFYYMCTNLKDYFYSTVSGLPTLNLSISKSAKVSLLQQTIQQCKDLETNGLSYFAEEKIKKVI